MAGSTKNSLQGGALHAYWNVLTPHEKSSYDLAKMALSQFLGASVQARIDHAAVVKVKLSDSIQDMIDESVQHIWAFTKSTDTAAEIELKWMMVRTLAKCTRECADTVWSNQPTTPAQLAQEFIAWESKHGNSRRLDKKSSLSQLTTLLDQAQLS